MTLLTLTPVLLAVLVLGWAGGMNTNTANLRRLIRRNTRMVKELRRLTVPLTPQHHTARAIGTPAWATTTPTGLPVRPAGRATLKAEISRTPIGAEPAAIGRSGYDVTGRRSEPLTAATRTSGNAAPPTEAQPPPRSGGLAGHPTGMGLPVQLGTLAEHGRLKAVIGRSRPPHEPDAVGFESGRVVMPVYHAEPEYVARHTPAGRRWVPRHRRLTLKQRAHQWWTCTAPRDVHAPVRAAQTATVRSTPVWRTGPVTVVIGRPPRELVGVGHVRP